MIQRFGRGNAIVIVIIIIIYTCKWALWTVVKKTSAACGKICFSHDISYTMIYVMVCALTDPHACPPIHRPTDPRIHTMHHALTVMWFVYTYTHVGLFFVTNDDDGLCMLYYYIIMFTSGCASDVVRPFKPD